MLATARTPFARNYLITPLGETAMVKQRDNGALFLKAERFLASRAVLPDERFRLPLVLWAAHTHCWQECQFVLPYLGFVGMGGSGKNRAMSLVGSMCNRYYMATMMTPAALRDNIHEKEPTLGVEECEQDLLTHGSPLHRIFNGGYMPGSTVDKKGPGGKTVPLNIYCPKTFAAVGDPESTLRRRCIIVPMEAGTPAVNDEPQVYMALGERIGKRLHTLVTENVGAIAQVYRRNHFKVPETLGAEGFQNWKPLWAICEVLLPERLPELQRISTYIAAVKSRPTRTVADRRLMKDKIELVRACNWLLEDAERAVKTWSPKNIRTTELIRAVLAERDGYWEGYQYLDSQGDGVGIGDKHGDGVFAKMLRLASNEKLRPEVRYMAPKESAHGYSVAEICAAALELKKG
jgi:hypothetical protein